MTLLPWAFALYLISSLISMAVMSVGAVVLMVALLVDFRGPKPLWNALRDEFRHSVWMRRYLWLSLALAAACVASLLHAKLSPLGYGGRFVSVRFFSEIAKLWYFIWPPLLVVGLRRLGETGRNSALRAWLGAFAVLSVVGVIQYFIGWPRPQIIPFTDGTPHVRYHATLFLGHHLSVASVWIFPFFAVLDLAFSKREGGLFPRKVLLLFAALGGVTLFLGYSRMLWIALPVGVFLWLLWRLPTRGRIAAPFVVAVVLGALLQIPSVQTRVNDSMGISERGVLWKINLQFFGERPILGVGWRHNHELSGIYQESLKPGQHVFAGHAHNNFVDMLAGTGVVGAAAWLAWCLGILLLVWQSRKTNHRFTFAAGLFCAWIVFHLNGLTQVNFWEAKVEHQMMIALAWSLLWSDS